MKKLIFLSVLFLIYSCKGQNSKNFNDCDIAITNDIKEFEELYSNIDTTTIYNNVILSFNKVNSGVLLYQINHNNKFGNFLIIDNQEQKCRIIKKGLDKNVNLSEKDKLFFKSNIPSIKNINYYQTCKNDDNNSVTLFIIKNEGIIVARYFSKANQFLKSKDIGDENYQNVMNLLKVAYKRSFD
ncbi:hypothetical protein [Flavobacterium lipolyticum]|uniref:Lipoprotein n=1 Tax=Flavobacterium lipolyticum TaxID=2893754 RepID=A0ABS8M7B7_9FLAO|nr:hypothetical protein [Flavobacterium sp. F-126]MCC9020222.1 hypothetical protein [Flavobacterium sp. F-126]